MKKGFICMLGCVAGAVVGAAMVGKATGKTIEEKQEKVDKFKNYYSMLNKWLLVRQEGRTLEEYFIANEIKTIAIYGMGELGVRLYEELRNSSLMVKYAIDKQSTNQFSELEIKNIEDDLSEVDAIVVTATFAYDEIERMLSEKCLYQIISLEDILCEL